MTSRKWIWAVLITLVVVAVLAVGGCALYRYGYMRGAMAGGVGKGLAFQDYKKMPFQGEHMGEGFMFHDEDMPFQGEHMGEGFMFHDSKEMPYQGEHMGTMPHNFQGRFNSPAKGCGVYGAPIGRSYHNSYFASPFVILLHLLFLVLIVWVLVVMIKRFSSGKSWQLSFTSTAEDEPEAEAKPKRGSKGK